MSISRNNASNILSLYLSENPELRLSKLVEEARDIITPTIAEMHCVNYSDEEMLAYLYVAYSVNDSWDKDITNTVILYHGTPQKEFQPNPNYVNENTDYGSGLYLTPYIELAKEWSATTIASNITYVHSFSLNLSGLSVFDFDQVNNVIWLAELCKHYQSNFQRANKKNISDLINMFNMYSLERYDVLTGWCGDAAYMEAIERILTDTLSVEQIKDVLHLGDLKEQYCLKSVKAYNALIKIGVEEVDANAYNKKYLSRMQLAENTFYSMRFEGTTLTEYLED